MTIKTPVIFTTAVLKVAASSSCGTSPQKSITLNAAPGNLSALITGPSQVVAGSVNVYSLPSASGLSYSWVADGCSVIGGQGTTSASIKVNRLSGYGYVKVTIKNSCGTAPLAQKYFTIQPASLNATLAMNGSGGSESSFGAYPNPFHDAATVVFTSKQKDIRYELRVVDLYGQILLARSGLTVAGVNTISLHLGKYAKGMYMVTLVTDIKVRSQKLFKSN